MATTESYAHPLYKQKIVEADDAANSTEYTHVFGRARWPGAAHRVLKTPFFETWKNNIAADESEMGQPIIGSTTIFDIVSLNCLTENLCFENDQFDWKSNWRSTSILYFKPYFRFLQTVQKKYASGLQMKVEDDTIVKSTIQMF